MSGSGELVPFVQRTPTPTEQLTEQFYEWESRGRGWTLWDYPVEIEPIFRPFVDHYIPSHQIFDDGRKPTLLNSLIEKVRGFFPGPISPSIDTIENEWEEIPPEFFVPESPIIELQVSLPPKQSISKEVMSQFIIGLTHTSHPLSFEIVGKENLITVQLACQETDRQHIVQQFKGYFPEAVIQEERGLLNDFLDRTEAKETVIIDFGLSHEFMLPIKTVRGFEIDPLIGIISAMSDLEDEELGLFQIIFKAARYPWAESVIRSVTDWNGKAFFNDSPEMVSLAKDKVSSPMFAAIIRVGAQSPVSGRAWQIAKSLGSGLSQFNNPGSNELIPLSNDGYLDIDHHYDLLFRQTHRSGMLLNSDELISLVHLPGPSVRSEKLKREEKRTKSVPNLALGHKLLLGENYHNGKTSRVTLSPDQRTKHTYIIGASGTGKSTLLLNMIIQDIQNGEGVSVLDPHGDLIDQILGYIPEERFSDVILFDPSDAEFPVGFNILSAHSEIEKNLLASDLVSVFKRLSTSWGDQMTSVLGNAIIAILENKEGGTLIHLRRFLVDSHYRRDFLRNVNDPEILFYWEKEYPLLSGRPQAPILTRLDSFLRPKLIRNMVSQKKNRLDFGAIMNREKIFLAKLAQGSIGEDNSYLLGTLLVSKLHQIAISRQNIKEAERKNFYLYIDEFQNFITPSMASILSGARKYHLGLILAHQELRQTLSKDQDVASAVISNPYTRICFRLGDFDAHKLKDGFSFYEAKDLQNLGIGEAIGRIEQADYDFNLKTLPLPVVDMGLAKQNQERLIALSREKYASRKEAVEEELAKERPSPSTPTVVKEKKIKKEENIEPKAPPIKVEYETKPVKESPKSSPVKSTTLGRGGQQHKYLQQLIKRIAEEKGFRAIIEKQVLDGAGSVDVSLEKEDQQIACEISVTSTAQQELGNIQKCIAAGFNQVILLSSEMKTLRKLKDFVSENLEEESLKKVLFFLPEEFISFLEKTEAKEKSNEQRVRGYKVKVNYTAIEESDKKARRQAIAKVILQAMKRLNN
ncbi:MAG: type IV secretory system conjugative DNA transfer family protein [Nitrospinales bacterium]